MAADGRAALSAGHAPEFIHGTAVLLGERAVLLRGVSGSGKSTLAEELLVQGSAAGLFTRLLGDDRIGLLVLNGRLVVEGHAAVAGLIERRGQGLVTLPFVRRAVLGLAVDLPGPDPLPRYPDPPSPVVDLCGISVPWIPLATRAMGTAVRTILCAMQHGTEAKRAFHLPN